MKTVIREGYSHLRQRFRLRALEWQNACISVGWGTMVLARPDLFEGQSFSGFIGGPFIWGSLVLLVGLVNFCALIINGTVPRPTALLRTLSAGATVFLYLMITIGFLVSGTGTTGITTYGFLALFGGFGGIWALLDAVKPEYDT